MRRSPRSRAAVEEPRFIRAAGVPKLVVPPPRARASPRSPVTWPRVCSPGRRHTSAVRRNAESRPRYWVPPAEVTRCVASGAPSGRASAPPPPPARPPRPGRARTCLRLRGRGRASVRAAPGSRARPGGPHEAGAARWGGGREPERAGTSSRLRAPCAGQITELGWCWAFPARGRAARRNRRPGLRRQRPEQSRVPQPPGSRGLGRRPALQTPAPRGSAWGSLRRRRQLRAGTAGAFWWEPRTLRGPQPAAPGGPSPYTAHPNPPSPSPRNGWGHRSRLRPTLCSAPFLRGLFLFADGGSWSP